MLGFICMVFVEMLSTVSNRKIQNENVCLPRIEPATPHLPACPSNYSAIGAVDDMLLKLSQYLFTLRYYKIYFYFVYIPLHTTQSFCSVVA